MQNVLQLQVTVTDVMLCELQISFESQSWEVLSGLSFTDFIWIKHAQLSWHQTLGLFFFKLSIPTSVQEGNIYFKQSCTFLCTDYIWLIDLLVRLSVT